jgi:hypothetical protein
VLYANSKKGQYTLEEAFEIAEKIDLATAYAEGLQGWQQGGTSAVGERRGGGEPRGFARARVAAAAADMRGGPCYRCGAADHMAKECHLGSKVTCGVCHKAGHMREACWEVNPLLRTAWAGAGSKEDSGANSRDRAIKDLKAQVAELTRQVAALAGKPVWNARQAEMRPLEEYGDEEPEVTAGATMCNACEGCDLSRDWVDDSGGEMDPREKFV